MQLFLGAQLSNNQLIELLKDQKSAHVDRLLECQAAQLAIEPSTQREQILQRLVLNFLQQREKTYLNWLEEAIESVNNLPDSRPVAYCNDSVVCDENHN
ncbi:MAG: hypothetical protein F6K28_54325, partial [Microcoleus sp. SIO2G3]|nr:hypothetical protein [Microcoleus sp. SIO2G3]